MSFRTSSAIICRLDHLPIGLTRQRRSDSIHHHFHCRDCRSAPGLWLFMHWSISCRPKRHWGTALDAGTSPSCAIRYSLLRLSFKYPANSSRVSHLSVPIITYPPMGSIKWTKRMPGECQRVPASNTSECQRILMKISLIIKLLPKRRDSTCTWRITVCDNNSLTNYR